MSLSLRTSGSEASHPAFKQLTRILREIDRRALLPWPRNANECSEMAGNRFEQPLFRRYSFTDNTRLVH